MVRIAYRVAYDGRNYAGYQRQPDQSTVESNIFQAFYRNGVDLTQNLHSYASASRTDRGVHAFSQTIAITYPDKPVILRAVNAALPHDITIWGSAKVKDEFHPRYEAKFREYLYSFALSKDESPVQLNQIANIFVGNHDFRHFLTPKEKGGRTELHVEHCEIKVQNSLGILIVRAPSFFWHQIRKMITGIRWVAKGELSLKKLQQYLANTVKPPSGIPPASPEGLVLSQIKYDIEWEVDPYSLTRVHRYWRNLEEIAANLWGSSKSFLNFISEINLV